MAWDHPSIGKGRKGRGPATKKAKRRRQASVEATREADAARIRARVADRRHDRAADDDVRSGGTLATNPRPRLGHHKRDRY